MPGKPGGCCFSPTSGVTGEGKAHSAFTSIVGSLTWEIERLTREAQQHELDLGSSPTDRLYVPTAVWGKVFHPGKNSTTQFFQRLFWWLSLVKDAQEYAAARSVCAQNKVPNTLPAGLI